MKTKPWLKNSRKKTSLEIVKTKENAFLDFNLEELQRKHLKKKQEQKYSDPMTRKIPRMTTTRYQKKVRMANETVSI